MFDINIPVVPLFAYEQIIDFLLSTSAFSQTRTVLNLFHNYNAMQLTACILTEQNLRYNYILI